MREERWTAVTRSEFDHERTAFEQLRAVLPDGEPYRAWSNFTFTATSGHPYEVDVLVLGPAGLYLVEVKSWVGELGASGGSWVHRSGERVEYLDNPFHLADSKAKKLKGLLSAHSGGTVIPFIAAAVYLSKPQLTVTLAEFQRHGVYGECDDMADIAELLTAPPRRPEHRITAARGAALAAVLDRVGIRRSQRHYQVGAWNLATRPLASGPTWQDHLATHRDLPSERRRVRLYLVERQASTEQQESVERAARREVAALSGVEHPGIVRVDSLEHHDVGPALVYRYDPRSLRLDQFLDIHGERLRASVRLGMIRQLADAVGYAHRRRLYHRALSACCVLVRPGPGGGDAGWLQPRLEVIDWYLASRESGDSVGSVSATAHGGFHLDRVAGAYLAPEWRQPDADPIAMDVFGLGALAYAVLTGRAPADDAAELLQRLAADGGLRPSAVQLGLSGFADELVLAATAAVPRERLSAVTEFEEMLDELERDTIPSRPPSTEPVTIDPLEAHPGDQIGEWSIVERLGTGSTSRAFLATDGRGVKHVLKVALSQEKAPRLAHEAAVLGRLRSDSRVIRLRRPDPIELGGRSALVFEFVSKQTLARRLRADGRLTADELATYGDQLFDVVAFLEGESVTHRDIKPDNIVIRTRPNRTKTPVLFDFSLASTPVGDVTAGTIGYLDPFLGVSPRMTYDQAAERYALAVTLHEMASGQVPVWGDGRTEPRLTTGGPVLATEAFEPDLREGLRGFLARALHRDAARRFPSLREMRLAWNDVLRKADTTPPVSVHPEPDIDGRLLTEQELADTRDTAAAAAGLTTALASAGLSPRAVATAARAGANTVGELLDVAVRVLFNLPGTGANTRRELQTRIKQWRTRLAPLAATPTTTTDTPAADPAVLGLDEVAALLLPARTTRNATEWEATRLLLGLPDAYGALPARWPLQPTVATQLGVTPGRIAQVLIKQRRRWSGLPAMVSLYEQVLDLLRQYGRVAGILELADALITARGHTANDEAVRQAYGLSAVRAVVEWDAGRDEPLLKQRRSKGRIMLALEVDAERDGPQTPTSTALLDYADALGRAADRLASEPTLPGAATVLRTVRAVARPPGDFPPLDERRLVHLAATASSIAASNARLEIYPRDLSPARALRLAQAGIVPPGGLPPKEIAARVASWFPALAPLPTDRVQLGKLLEEAGFRLRWESGRFTSPQLGSSIRARSLRSGTSVSSLWTADSPEVESAFRADEQLAASYRNGGFRALTLRPGRLSDAITQLTADYDARALSVASLFFGHLRSLVAQRPKPTWETVARADLAPPDSTDAIRLAALLERAWVATAGELAAACVAASPALLTDAAVFARHRGMSQLRALRAIADRPGRVVWLLCPMFDPGAPPHLDRTAVDVAPYEWTVLSEGWLTGHHRAA